MNPEKAQPFLRFCACAGGAKHILRRKIGVPIPAAPANDNAFVLPCSFGYISLSFGKPKGEVISVDKQKQKKPPTAKDERPISPAYGILDNDLGRDNLENDLTAADRQDV